MPPGSQFGAYTLVKLIAVGGMAEIYLATHKGVGGFEKQLALKVIHPEYADDKSFVQMLVDEAKLSVTLNHPNIVQTFDLGQLGRIYYISMEFVDGCDYFQLLRKITEHQEVPVPAALFVARGALEGLDYAHNKVDEATGQPLKIIHRDISPQNILVSRRGDVKLVDFGIAKAANLSTKTRAGVIKGKLVYMSPEQSWGDPVDQRTDIFSAGVVLYEALTGGSLYLETNPVKLLQQVRKAEIPPPSSIRPELDAELDAVVMRALAPRPADRYQRASEFAEAVGSYLQRHRPQYDAIALGELVERVLNREAPPAQRQVAGMERDDFAAEQHSLIFSAEEMMEGADGQDLSAPQSGGSPGFSQREGPDVEFNVPVGQQDLGKGASAKLMLLEEDGTKSFDIEEQFIIGRGGDLRLSDGRVSRRHARIVAHEGGYLLEDLKSSNGTYLNDEKVRELKRLKHGDRIRIGPFKMQFVLESARAPAPPPRSTPPPPPHKPPLPATGAQPRPGPPPPPPRPSSPPPPRLSSPPPPRPSSPPPPRPPRPSSSPPTPAVARGSAGPTSPAPTFAPEGAADMTAKPRRLACMRVKMDDETLSLPIDGRLVLGQRVSVGDMPIDGPSGVVSRRGEAYWIEPVPHRHPIALNGHPLERPTQLSRGDNVVVGTLELQFALGD